MRTPTPPSSGYAMGSPDLLGIACGAGAALFWAAGFVAARHGITVGFSPADVAFHRFVWAGLAFLPIFLANLVFASSFKGTGSEADVAFASNLLGIMAGGMLEYSALLIGYRHLLLFVIAFYLASALLGRTIFFSVPATVRPAGAQD